MKGTQPVRGGQEERALILWHSYLTGDPAQLDSKTKVVRRVFRRLPSDPRCRVCNAPFRGVGSIFVRLLGFRAGRSSLNPTLCDRCEVIVKQNQVGAEVPLTLLFADVRGSTSLAEEMGASAFHRQINRFYTTCTEILIQTHALIEKMIGDEVAGMYVPGIAGPDHARKAVDAARALLAATGHADPEGPWIRTGVGVHTGVGYVGAVGSSQGVSDITVLGDVANTTARLASEAAAGEILVSEAACRAAGLSPDRSEERQLQLKGRNQSVTARVIRVLDSAS
ncbi:MAG TPA: adenylate/guanylate cyclase domain-containing protein [Anaerolineaceae bacterium]|nr:adenylate/guanylate cyclase domain-containing protein [Anaerolineaceae bacterium]